MSTLVYATVSRPRKGKGGVDEAFDPGESVGAFVESVAALVPAEVLLLHATILGLTTETVTQNAEATGEEVVVTTITEPRILFWTFLGLVVMSILLYVVPLLRKLHTEEKQWQWGDYARMVVPPASFVVWTMLQKTTAFDAMFPGLAEVPRLTIALFGAVLLTLWAATFSYKKPEGGNDAAETLAEVGDGGSTPLAPCGQMAANAGDAEASH